MNWMYPSASSVGPKTRIRCIQAFRGVAALLVVLFHLKSMEVKYFHTNLMGVFQFSWVGVDLFFVISGVVISLVTVGKFQNRENAISFLYHRFARIYPTFWAFFAVVLAAYLYNPLWINASSGHQVEILQSFLLFPSEHSNLIPQAWTLSFELYFYLVFFFFLWLIPERYLLRALGTWALVIATFDFFFPAALDSTILGIVASPYVFEFLAGSLLFQIYRRFSFDHHASRNLILSSLLGYFAVVCWSGYAHNSESVWLKDSFWLRPVVCGSLCLLFLLGMMQLERLGRLRIHPALQALGDWSFSIYLSHEISIELVGRAAARWFPNLPFVMLYVDAVAIPMVILIGYFSYTWIERPLMAQLCRPPVSRVVALAA